MKDFIWSIIAGLAILPAFGEDVVDKTKSATKKAGDKIEDAGDKTW